MSKRKYVKRAAKCAVFVNDIPGSQNGGLEAGLWLAENEGWHVIQHWRVKGGSTKEAERHLAQVCDLVAITDEIEYVILVNCYGQMNKQFLADKLDDLMLAGKDVQQICSVQPPPKYTLA